MSESCTFPGTDRNRIVELDIHESGSVWFTMQIVGQEEMQFNGISYTALYVDRIVSAVLEVLIALRLLSESFGFVSAWDLACIVTNARGKRPTRATQPGNAFGPQTRPVYEADSYAGTARATVMSLEKEPEAVLDRLLGRLVRSVGMEVELAPLLNAANSSD